MSEIFWRSASLALRDRIDNEFIAIWGIIIGDLLAAALRSRQI
jgi:hypothetical protein